GYEPVSRRSGRIFPQPGSRCPQLFYLTNSREPDGSEAAVAEESVRIRGRWAGDHPEAVQREGQDVLYVFVRRPPPGTAGNLAFKRTTGGFFHRRFHLSAEFGHHRRCAEGSAERQCSL